MSLPSMRVVLTNDFRAVRREREEHLPVGTQLPPNWCRALFCLYVRSSHERGPADGAIAEGSAAIGGSLRSPSAPTIRSTRRRSDATRARMRPVSPRLRIACAGQAPGSGVRIETGGRAPGVWPGAFGYRRTVRGEKQSRLSSTSHNEIL